MPRPFLRLLPSSAVRGLSVALAAVACVRPQAAPSRALPPASAVDRLRGGATLALPRPTPEVAWLSLWIPVGSRDAQPPQLATAVAWLIADRAGAEARVEPNATEVTLRCDVAGTGIAACVERLGRAITRTDASDTEATGLRERVRTTRLRAAGDPGRRADERALQSLLGRGADGFFPLGQARDDALVTAPAVAAFLTEHVRVDRSLLVAAGDVQDQALDRAFARFRPRGEAPALAPPDAPSLRSGLSVAEDERGNLTFALATPDVQYAAAIAKQIEALYAGASTRVARLPSFALLHVRMPAGAAPFARLQRATFDLRRLALELPHGVPPPRGDRLPSLAREVGERWIMRGIAPRQLAMPWPMGVAVTLRAVPGAASAEPTPARRLELARAAQDAVSAGEAAALGPIEGTETDEVADVEVPNGVRIRVQRRPGDRWMGAALQLDAGSRDDPETEHGRGALLATWLSNGCGFAQGRALTAQLNAIDAHAAPVIDADTSGVTMVASVQNWQPALDALLRCAVRPAQTARAIEDARLRLISALTRQQGALYEAFAARALMGDTPGFVASWGTPRGVSSVSAPALRRLHREAMQGGRLSVMVAVDAAPQEVARFIARRVAQLARGGRPEAAMPGTAAQAVIGEQLDVPALRVVAALRTDGDTRGHVAPGVVAAAFRDALSRRAGQPVWHGGRGNATLSYGAVALSVTERELPNMEAQTRASLHELAGRSDAWWQTELRSAQLERRSRLSEAEGWAEMVSQTPLSGPSLSKELEAVRRLLTATPRFAMLRPGP